VCGAFHSGRPAQRGCHGAYCGRRTARSWVAGQLRISDRTGWLLLVPLALADTCEVVWVSVQRWRGVASHFNNDTTLDSLLFLVMGGGAIAVAATVILVMTVLAFTAMRPRPAWPWRSTPGC
jgi:hypothetical protein